MITLQFSINHTFLESVVADKKYSNWDVVIKRPNCWTYTDRDMELKAVLTEVDILGNKSVEYFIEKWKKLMKKCRKNSILK